MHIICWFICIFWFLFLAAPFPATVKGTVCAVSKCTHAHVAHEPVDVSTREAVNAVAALFTLFILHVNTSAVISPPVCTFVCVYKCSEAGAKLYMHNITSSHPVTQFKSTAGDGTGQRSRGTCARVRVSVEFDSENRIRSVYQIDGDENRSAATQKNTCVQINVVNGGLWGDCPLWMDTHMLHETRPEDYLRTRTHVRTYVRAHTHAHTLLTNRTNYKKATIFEY